MIKQAGRRLKDRAGRAAYLYAGARSLGARPVKAVIEVDGRHFFRGRISCVLAGNVSTVMGRVEVFEGARQMTACWNSAWSPPAARFSGQGTLGRVAVGDAAGSPFVHLTRGRKFRLRFERKLPYELDGGARHAVKKMRIKVRPSSVTICVPAPRRPGAVRFVTWLWTVRVRDCWS